MDPFATLGLPRRFELDEGDLEARYRDLQRALHPDRHVAAPPNERRLSLSKAIEVNAAYRVLKSDLQRAEALLSLLTSATTGGPSASEGDNRGGTSDPGLLMEMMEQREALSEAKAARDPDRVAALADAIKRERARTLTDIAAAFAGALDVEGGADRSDALGRARDALARLKYHERFLDEVAVIEDELL